MSAPVVATAASGALLYFGYTGWNAICETPQTRTTTKDTHAIDKFDLNNGWEILNEPVVVEKHSIAVPLGAGWDGIGMNAPFTHGNQGRRALAEAWARYNGTQQGTYKPDKDQSGQIFAWRGFIAGIVSGGLSFIWGSVLSGWSLYIPLLSAGVGFFAMTAIQFYSCIIDSKDDSELTCILDSLKKVFEFVWDGIKEVLKETACFCLSFLRNIPVAGSLLNPFFISPMKKAIGCPAQ